jgi:hypothetical protein
VINRLNNEISENEVIKDEQPMKRLLFGFVMGLGQADRLR